MQTNYISFLWNPFYPLLPSVPLPPQSLCSVFPRCAGALLHHPSITTRLLNLFPSSSVDPLFMSFHPLVLSLTVNACVSLRRRFQRQSYRGGATDASVIVHSEHTKGSSSPDSYSDWLGNTNTMLCAESLFCVLDSLSQFVLLKF